ncbi:MAG TPA: hypothetical protein VF980_02790 [Thermoanaerobaculia bacterium]
MRVAGDERREFQRLRVDPPIPATLGNIQVMIVDAGVLGARVQHALPLEDKYADLRFTFRDQPIAMHCEIVRTTMSGETKLTDSSLQSGLRFVWAIEGSGDKLRRMLAQLVAHEFDSRRKVPADTMPQHASVDGDKTVRGADAAFLCYRYDGGVWRKRRVFLPEQPPAGFTVARIEDSTEMQRLCRVYETADEEGRRLIRLFAELSVSDVLQIPPNS